MISQFQKSTRVIVTGSIAYDDIMVFPNYFKDYFHPERLHQINVSFAVNSLVKHIGGTATNIAYGLRKITEKDVSIMSTLGQDYKEIAAFYDTNNIDYSQSYIDPKLYCSTGKVITDCQNNQIWGYYYGASVNGDKVKFDKLKKTDVMIISANHENAFLHAQRFCIKNKIPYLYDPGMALTWIKDSDLEEGIKHAAILVGNDYENAQIVRRLNTTEAAIIANGTVFVTTLGAHGVRYKDTKQEFEVPGYAVKKVVDPTGAGDAWRGGFVAALMEGHDVKEALKVANALASFTVEYHGTVSYAPKKKDIEKRAQSLG